MEYVIAVCIFIALAIGAGMVQYARSMTIAAVRSDGDGWYSVVYQTGRIERYFYAGVESTKMEILTSENAPKYFTRNLIKLVTPSGQLLRGALDSPVHREVYTHVEGLRIIGNIEHASNDPWRK